MVPERQNMNGFTLTGKTAILRYPREFKTLPDYTAHRDKPVLIGEQLSEQEADRGEDLERMFHVTAEDGWKGHAFEPELEIEGEARS